MKSSKEIFEAIRATINSSWSRRNVYDVPDSEDIRLGDNSAVVFEGCVLYADMKGSTELVSGYKDYFVASIYKSFLVSACDVISNNGGKITSFDGDRVMAIYKGRAMCTNAVKTALQIKFVVDAVNKSLGEKYPSTQYKLEHAVGVDVSDLFAIRTGIRNHNDIAWIGEAANVAAKLSEIRGRSACSFITDRVYERMADTSKFGGNPSRNMWCGTGIAISGHSIYGSTWTWKF